jgi:hypothetical protein
MYVDFDYRTFEMCEDVTIEVKPLEAWAYQAVLKFLQTSSNLNEDQLEDPENIKYAVEKFSNPELDELTKKILPVHCKDLRGLTIKKDGLERYGEIADILESSMFMIIKMNILIHLFNITTIKGGESKEIKK